MSQRATNARTRGVYAGPNDQGWVPTPPSRMKWPVRTRAATPTHGRITTRQMTRQILRTFPPHPSHKGRR